MSPPCWILGSSVTSSHTSRNVLVPVLLWLAVLVALCFPSSISWLAGWCFDVLLSLRYVVMTVQRMCLRYNFDSRPLCVLFGGEDLEICFVVASRP